MTNSNNALQILRNIDKPAENSEQHEALSVLLAVSEDTPTYRSEDGELEIDAATQSLEELASGIQRDAGKLVQLLERKSKTETEEK